MKLKDLLKDIPHEWTGLEGNPDVTGLCYDSRRVRPGDLFVALNGKKHDGHDHVPHVVRAGAVAVVAERPLSAAVPVIVVTSALRALSPLSAVFYGRPSESLSVVGVTGTNGKTTVTYMMESVLKAAGRKPGVIGTVEYRWADHRESAPNTTPLSAELQRLLARMREEEVTHVAMEVSSHALALHRVDDVAFTVGVFTNLTRDHLDFHQDMDTYFLAKAKLFQLLSASRSSTEGKKKCAIMNADDGWSEKFAPYIKTRTLTYGIKRPCDFAAVDVALSAEGTSCTLVTPEGRFPFKVPLVGLHNIYNALAAVAAASALDIPLESARRGLETMAGVPGRLERVTGASPAPFSVFVDYAHTDDALKNVLQALRPLTEKRLITVFGCGGDRDRTKRPLMGEAAMKLSDHVIVTSDNPRSEDPQKIALDIEVGVRRAGGTHYEVHLDRETAIAKALSYAKAGDVVLIAGKGHETYQIFRDGTVDFDDREVARKILERREK
jgi:UDP-N-acetylmuramoyl-L-alanyl-D-glutamate--2,6-diaminopimelate ligase